MTRAPYLVAALGIALLVGSPLGDESQQTGVIVKGRNFFASPDGARGAPGTAERPLSLQVALSEESPARPGDTIWLRGGTYRGSFESWLKGYAQAPITVREYPGETAVIDSAPSLKPALTVSGSWTIFRDFVLTNSDGQRRSQQTGPWPSDLQRGSGVHAVGQGTQLINLVIHDMADGIGMFSESRASSAYGNIVFNNGWAASDRAHGHGIYTQNEFGSREIEENILFNQFSHGIHAYGSSSAHLDQIVLRGNIAFNNGVIGSVPERDILLGGGRQAVGPVVADNMTYGPGQSNIGYAAGCSDGTISGNYFVGAAPLILVACEARVFNNFFAGPAGWSAETGPENFVVTDDKPSGVITLVRPNRHEPGRANIVVYNWDQHPAVAIDASGILDDDDQYEVRDVQNYFGPPVAAGVYRRGALIRLPLEGLQAAAAVGDVPAQPRHTGPEFAVFVLRRLNVPLPE